MYVLKSNQGLETKRRREGWIGTHISSTNERKLESGQQSSRFVLGTYSSGVGYEMNVHTIHSWICVLIDFDLREEPHGIGW